MKNLYPKSKGKIHPSPSSAAAASSGSSEVLNLLPAAIFALISALAADDRDVLAYLILRSTKSPSLMLEESRKCKKAANAAHRPLLDCPCFDCYTSFWLRWDSSPNRELIHQAIEAFEEHLARDETPKKSRKKDRRLAKVKPAAPVEDLPEADAAAEPTPDADADADAGAGSKEASSPERQKSEEDGALTADLPEPAEAVPKPTGVPASNGRGLVRKVWPDVMGMFNSRMWGLWNPNA